MMKRAEQLCLQAENGTYSELERQELTDELNALYDEMERIFFSAEFSDIKLFQYETPDDVGDFPKDLKEYIEHTKKLTPDGTYAEWGDLEIIGGERVFEDADPAKGATATIQLDSEVNTNDASSLNGKSFYIKPTSGTTAYVNFSADKPDGVTGKTHEGGTYYYDYTICTNDCATVEQAMEKLCTLMQGSYLHESGVVKDIAVAANGQVTFTFGSKDLSGNFGFPMDDGDGTLSNGVKIFSEQSTMLNPVDAVDNKVKIASGVMTVELFDGEEFSALSAEKKAALKHALLHNSIRLGYNGEEFKLSDLLAEKILAPILLQHRS